MSQTVGDFLVERLHAWGVRRICGHPGDGINGVFGALNRAKDKIRIYVDSPEALGPAWDEALAADRPVVLDVRTDPEAPPLPPHITFDEAVKLSETVVKGDPDEGNMIIGAARQLVGALLPHDED